jgi:CubicO group peptidase (beta-lactamase class C family)
LQVSANDYAKWVAFLLSAWPPRDAADTGPVKRATVREMAQGLNFVSVSQRAGKSGPDACRLASAYAMGWRVAQDCDLGLTLAHGGGYPGYGSHVMLMPEFGYAVFALSNRTYAGPSGPAWDTAVAMHKAGMLVRAPEVPAPALVDMVAAARAAYDAGNLTPLEGKLAMNRGRPPRPARRHGNRVPLELREGVCRRTNIACPDNAADGAGFEFSVYSPETVRD